MCLQIYVFVFKTFSAIYICVCIYLDLCLTFILCFPVFHFSLLPCFWFILMMPLFSHLSGKFCSNFLNSCVYGDISHIAIIQGVFRWFFHVFRGVQPLAQAIVDHCHHPERNLLYPWRRFTSILPPLPHPIYLSRQPLIFHSVDVMVYNVWPFMSGFFHLSCVQGVICV